MRQLEKVEIKVNRFPNQKDFGKSFMLGSSLDDETYPLRITGNALIHDNYDADFGNDTKRTIRPLNSQEDSKGDGDQAL